LQTKIGSRHKSADCADDSQSQAGFCAGCTQRYGAEEDNMKDEEWLQCNSCINWYHESCAEDNGILDDLLFTCKNCS